MADQQEHPGTSGFVNDVPIAKDSAPSLRANPIVDMPSEDEMKVERVTDPSYNLVSTNLTAAVSHIAPVPALESPDMPQESEHNEVLDPAEVAPSESAKNSAPETGSGEAELTGEAPAQTINHPTGHASFSAPTTANHPPSEPIVETGPRTSQEEPQITVRSVDRVPHSSYPEPATKAPLDDSSEADKQPGHEEPESSVLPTKDVSTSRDNSPEYQDYPRSTEHPDPVMAPNESETAPPPVTDAAQPDDPASASHEALRPPVEADNFMGQVKPVLEALAKSEASVAQDPASALIEINIAASELEHIMEQHGLNKNYEVQNASFNEDLDSLAHVHPGTVSGTPHAAQQHDQAVPQSVNAIPSAGEQSLTAHAPTPDTHIPIETGTVMGLHEPLGANPGTETPADSPSADGDMDDGSSNSTINAYLGAHASSLGTGSVHGDTSMNDGDSALGDDVESYVLPEITPQNSTEEKHNSITESLSASMLEYRYENGRRYHAFEDGKYHLPNDEKEADRLDFQHHIWLLTLNGELHRAPLSNTIQNVLDVGTGTGIWAIDFANAYPNARVIGTDLSPIQPSWVPPNLSFMVDDAEALQDWEFTQRFDYIHSRLVVLSMRDWPRYLKRCYDNLKPGGWIELQEVQFPFQYDDDFPPNDSPLLKWSGYVIEATSRVGVDTQAATKFVDLLRSEGFVNINKEEIRWPIGSWSKDPKEKELGKWMVYNALEGVESAGMALFSRVFGWSKGEILVFLESVRKDIRNKDARYYCAISVHYAQKPIEPGGEV